MSCPFRTKVSRLEGLLTNDSHSVNRRINFQMELTRFELVFFRNDGDVDKTIRVCIELNDEDMQVLTGGENERLNTHTIMQRTGILDHLQIGANDWHYSGRVLGHRDCLNSDAGDGERTQGLGYLERMMRAALFGQASFNRSRAFSAHER